MKKLTLLFTILFSMLFSSTAFAEWSEISSNVNGDTFYIDFDRIRKNNGYVYYWSLTDKIKPTESGFMSTKMYHQVDCGIDRFKTLSYIHFKQSMGSGAIDSSSNPSDPDWSYPPPESVSETFTKLVCKQ